MPLNRKSIHDLELHKFVESPSRPGEPAVEITGNITATSSPGPFSAPAGTDSVVRSVLGTVETYQYKTGGVSGTTLKTVVVTYADTDLEELISAVVS